MPGTAQVNTRTVKRAAGPFNPDRVEGERGGQRGTIKEWPESTRSEVRRVMGGNRGGGGREGGRQKRKGDVTSNRQPMRVREGE